MGCGSYICTASGLGRVSFFETQIIKECDAQMEIFLNSYDFGVENPSDVETVRSYKYKLVCRKNIINVDLEVYAYQMYGVNLMKIPGASKDTSLILVIDISQKCLLQVL